MTNLDADTDGPPARSRRFLWLGAGALGLLVVLYCAAWFGTAAVVRSETLRLIAAQRDGGVAVDTAPLMTSGFPGRVVLTIPDLTVTAPMNGGGWTWHAARVRVTTWPLWWRALDLDLAGTHRIAGVASAAQPSPVWITATTADGHLAIDGQGRLSHALLEATHITVAPSENGVPLLQAGFASAAVTLLAAQPASPQSATLPTSARLVLEARDIVPPKLFPAPELGPIIRAGLIAEVTGAWPAGPLPQVLDAWRGAGGTVEIRDALLDWPPVRIAGSGTLALDRTLQPVGSMALRIQGAGNVLDILVGSGVMAREAASMAKIGLALMSRRNAQGIDELAVPLVLQDRELSAGPLAIATLRSVAWPALAVP